VGALGTYIIYSGCTSLGITLLLVMGRLIALRMVLRDSSPKERPALIKAVGDLFRMRTYRRHSVFPRDADVSDDSKREA
jgi:hypothetical protein